MGTLIDEIEALRERLVASHEEEMRLAADLKAHLLGADAALMREVQEILDGHAVRRGDIVAALHTLAARIGYLPGGPRLRSAEPAAGHIFEPPTGHVIETAMPRVLAPTPAEQLADVLAAGRGMH